MWIARPREGAGSEERAAEIRAPAARAANDALWRMLERCARRREDPRLAQHVQRVLIDLDVQLVPRGLVERAAPIGADLRADAEVAQKGERASGGRRAREVEVNSHVTAAQVPRARRVKQRRELRVPAAATRGRDLRQLVTELVRERHARQRETPSSSSSRRL